MLLVAGVGRVVYQRDRVGAVKVALAAALVAGPLYGSVRVAQLMGHEDARVEALRWIEECMPAGTVCCNFGGWAGDVPVRTYEDHWWRLVQFEGSFGAVEELIDFLAATGPGRPFYSYTVQTGNREVERGAWDLAVERRCPYVLLHRHPLSYSRVDPGFAATLAEHGTRVAAWQPEGLASADPHYDAADAYYLPLANFGPLRQPGPGIEVWRLEDHPLAPGAPTGAREVFARALLIWATVELHADPAGPEARGYLRRALALGSVEAPLYNDIGIKYRKLGDHRDALAAWTRAVELDPDYGAALYNIALVHQLELGDPVAALPHWHRALAAGEDGVSTYAYLANAYMSVGRRAEAVSWLGALAERYPDSPEAEQVRALLQAQEAPP